MAFIFKIDIDEKLEEYLELCKQYSKKVKILIFESNSVLVITCKDRSTASHIVDLILGPEDSRAETNDEIINKYRLD